MNVLAVLKDILLIKHLTLAILMSVALLFWTVLYVLMSIVWLKINVSLVQITQIVTVVIDSTFLYVLLVKKDIIYITRSVSLAGMGANNVYFKISVQSVLMGM